MKTSHFTLFAGLVLAAAQASAADLEVTGNLTVSGTIGAVGKIDSADNNFLFGTQGGLDAVSLTYVNNTTDTLQILINRNPASWLWVHKNAALNADVPAMRLDSAHQLILYQANGSTAGVTLTPASNQLSLGTATLSGSGANLFTGGALTVAAGITNANGTLTGGTAGLTLNAGGTNQNITLTPSGTGYTILNGKVGIGTTSPDKQLTLYGSDASNQIGGSSTGIHIINSDAGAAGRVTEITFGGRAESKKPFAAVSAILVGDSLFEQAGDLTFSTKNVATATYPIERMRILGSGNVGIGTATPDAPLHAVGGAAMSAGWNRTAILQATYPVLAFNGNGTKQAGMGYDFGYGMRFWVNASSNDIPGTGLGAMTILNSGYVGIGTGSPSTRLHALGGSNYTGTIVADGPSSGYSSFGLYENGTYKASMYWHPGAAGVSFYGPSKWFFESGNVGIGTNSPGSRKLNVQSLDSTNDVGVEIGLGRTTGTNYGLIVSTTGLGAGLNQGIFTTARDGTSNYGLRIYNVLAAPSNYALFSDSPAQSYFQGNVGIGTTGPSALLHVKSPTGPLAVRFEGQANTYASKLYLSSVSSGDGGLQYDANDNTMSMFSYGDVKFHVGTGNISGAIANERMRITQSGYVGIGTNPLALFEIKKPNGGGRWQFVDEGADVYSAINIRNSANTAFLPFTFRSAGYTVNDGTADRLTVAVGGNVGVGTASPQARLQLGSLSDGTGEATNHGDLLFAKQNTTLAATGGIEWKIAPDNYGAKIDTIAAGGANLVFGLRNGATTWTESMRISPLGNVGIGTTTPGTYKLAVNGTIHAKEIIVDNTNWADFVFDANYRLAPLSEIEQHIKAKKHLPGIPSAQEIAEHGVSMGDMQAKLLSKIEELTLHMIQMEKENNALRQRVQKLEAANP